MKEYRVYGPPGTGKTTWVVDRVAEYAKMYGKSQVSVCSLTNTAVREASSRKLDIATENLTTLHSRCKKSLMTGAPAESHMKDFAKDNRRWSSTDGIQPCLPSYKRGEDAREEIAFNPNLSLFEEAQILRQQLIPKSAWPKLVREFHEVWDAWCKDNGMMDFTAWLEAALEHRPLPPQQVVIVDEAQDHTPLQLAVIRAWQTNNLILVGDDDQCCYEWSGALPHEFFKKTDNLEKEKVLEQSYRVPASVHALATRYAGKIKDRREKTYRPRDFQGEIFHSDYYYDMANYHEMPHHLLQNLKDPDQTNMIIASCGYMLNGIISLLMNERIPFHNPFRRSNHRWNPLYSAHEYIDSYMVGNRMWSGAEAVKWASKLSTKRGIFQYGKKMKFMSLCRSIKNAELHEDDIKAHFSEELWPEIFSKSLSFLDRYKSPKHFGNSWKYALDVRKQGDSEPRLTIGTIHSVKGGEADNVYLFPDLSSAAADDYHGDRSDRIWRLFYVGVTRAKRNLYLYSQTRPYLAVDWN